MKKSIKIECKGADILPLDAIEDFQGGLKKRGSKEISLIIKSIENYGFSFPFFIWQNEGHNYCLDGHGRIEALNTMRQKGVDLPLFPVVYVNAKSEEEAKNKLLRLNSTFGQMTAGSVLEFADGFEIETSEIMLPEGVLSFEDDVKIDDMKEKKEKVCPECGAILTK